MGYKVTISAGLVVLEGLRNGKRWEFSSVAMANKWRLHRNYAKYGRKV